MLKKAAFGVLTTMILVSTAYAETCPSASSFHKLGDGDYIVSGPTGANLKVNVDPDVDDATLKSLQFTSARLQDKDSSNAKVICRYENSTAGGSLGWPTGKPVQGAGNNWKGDDCVGNDPSKCPFN
ncbi:hypothetical protein [Pseudomonas sp. UV AK001]|uniref:hypothetical protein n=1 Tax=Pseudomonas sp. UV AK001 TaxID=3384791 RepID=UPI0038D479A3